MRSRTYPALAKPITTCADVTCRFEIDVDSLERELYAVDKSTDDFVEIPRWARLWDDARWFGGPGLSRRDVHLIAAFCVACAVIVFAGSFLVASDVTANVVRTGAVVALVCGYLVSVFIRISDTFSAEHAPQKQIPLPLRSGGRCPKGGRGRSYRLSRAPSQLSRSARFRLPPPSPATQGKDLSGGARESPRLSPWPEKFPRQDPYSRSHRRPSAA